MIHLDAVSPARWSLLLLAILVGCGDDESTTGPGGGGGAGAESATSTGQGGAPPIGNRRFLRLVDGFESLEACEEQTAGSGFNCQNELGLCANTGFWILLTDIITEGRCEPSGAGLRCTTRGAGDLSDGTTLTITDTDDGVEIAELPGDHPWLATEVPSYVAESCEAMTGRPWWE